MIQDNWGNLGHPRITPSPRKLGHIIWSTKSIAPLEFVKYFKIKYFFYLYGSTRPQIVYFGVGASFVIDLFHVSEGVDQFKISLKVFSAREILGASLGEVDNMVLARVNAKAKITEAKFLTGGYEDGAQEEEQVGEQTEAELAGARRGRCYYKFCDKVKTSSSDREI